MLLGTQFTSAQATPAQAFGSIGAFGSLELKADEVHGGRQWQRVISRISGEQHLYRACDEDGTTCPTELRAWRNAVRSMEQFQGWNLLAAVNSKINRLVTFRTDATNYGRTDYWASPVETLTRQGDCEDYAILKYMTLLELGVSDRQMRIVVVKDIQRGTGHAVLSVNMDGQTYILDNLRQAAVLHTDMSHYVPYYSVNRQGLWLNIATNNTGAV